ncbi:MAG: shikimate kinase [Lachnospiraceae bacterium]|nr:shikimate kinase [Lachnospiraceae bacterium]
MNHVILIGYMGCGKTTLGRKLTYKLRISMIDTDKWIEQHQKKTISEIFAEEGEESFRWMETECLKRLTTERGDHVISVGGGLPMRPENRVLLHTLGRVIYLRAKPETIYERLKDDTTRPLLQGDDPMGKIRAMIAERGPVYEECADVIIDVDGKDFDTLLEELVEAAQYRPIFRKQTYRKS